jgi:hypothetical protein
MSYPRLSAHEEAFSADLNDGRGGYKLSANEALCERELDLEMAEVLSARETLTVPGISVSPTIIVTPVIGVAVAVQALTVGSNNVAAVLQYLHVG